MKIGRDESVRVYSDAEPVLEQSWVLKNHALPSGLGHWFRNLGSLKKIIRNLCI